MNGPDNRMGTWCATRSTSPFILLVSLQSEAVHVVVPYLSTFKVLLGVCLSRKSYGIQCSNNAVQL
jgi:hypothetical protein